MASVQPLKRKGPAPTGKGTPVQVRLQHDQLAEVDAWRESRADKPSRPEAIRQLIAIAMQDRRQAPRNPEEDRRKATRKDRRQALRSGGRRAGEE